MVQPWGSGRLRVLAPHALGADEFLRVTWHEGDGIVVFSQWAGDTCIAAFPVRVAEISEVAELLAAALGKELRETGATVVPLGAPTVESA